MATTNRDSHFVGSIITYLPESEGLHAPVTQLIDGQQRITTIFMLLSLIRDRIFAQSSTYLPAEPNSGLASFDVGSKVTRVIFTSEERAIPRFVANPIIKDAFHDCVLRNPENLDSLRKTKIMAKTFRNPAIGTLQRDAEMGVWQCFISSK